MLMRRIRRMGSEARWLGFSALVPSCWDREDDYRWSASQKAVYDACIMEPPLWTPHSATQRACGLGKRGKVLRGYLVQRYPVPHLMYLSNWLFISFLYRAICLFAYICINYTNKHACLHISVCGLGWPWNSSYLLLPTLYSLENDLHSCTFGFEWAIFLST